MTDLLFGAADNYSFEQVRPWLASARQSGFEGEITLLVYRVPLTLAGSPGKPAELVNLKAFAEAAQQYDAKIVTAGSDSTGQQIAHTARWRDTQSHQMRFFHLWQFLTGATKNYRFVIATDVRDVIFQLNPVTWLTTETKWRDNTEPFIIAPSEGLNYQDEMWGAQNMHVGFGPLLYEHMQSKPIVNVGTIAGTVAEMRDLALIIYLMGENRYIPNDQSSFNILVQSALLKNIVRFTPMSKGWAAQCGTTLDLTKDFSAKWLEKPPVIKDGYVFLPDSGQMFTILHQYDRHPELAEAVRKRYATV